MPLPRYQPAKKKPKILSPSLDDLDDYCLTKIISYALILSRYSDQQSTVGGDSRKTEKNLSLVSRRWYYLTQTQVPSCGLHVIDLDKLVFSNKISNKLSKVGPQVPIARRPGGLVQKNALRPAYNTNQQHLELCDTYSIDLFRQIQPQLMKYKHVQIDGTLSFDEFRKLVVAIDAFRIEELILKIHVDKSKLPFKESMHLPQRVSHLKKLVLFWSDDVKREYSNALTWTIFLRANHLKSLEIYLDNKEPGFSIKGPSEIISANFPSSSLEPSTHDQLDKITFVSSTCRSRADCVYTSLIKDILMRDVNVSRLDTNDDLLIQNLVKLAERVSTAREVKHLQFSSPVKDTKLLSQLIESRILGTKHLSIVIDNLDFIKELRGKLEYFQQTRTNWEARCQVSIHLKDQKFQDTDEKINNLNHISRLSDLTVYISAQQRVSIDCCHLMWSIGRALLALSGNANGRCLFKIILQMNPTKNNLACSEITIPFGKYTTYNLNADREDFARHKEIMKALRRDCYHSFVKSVRDNIVV